MSDEVEEKNAVIKCARICIERGFILSAWLDLDYGGSCQGFGGYALFLDETATNHKKETTGAFFIHRVMKIADVEDWSKLSGKTIRVRASHAGVHAIGHIIKNDWFTPSEDLKKGVFND